jgi:site-specific DNA-methyltransferase (adenine-specific)
MEEIVRDYSNPGDLVCDPMAGTGATLVAALQLGRDASGSDIDPALAREANKTIGGLRKGPGR